MDLQKQITQIKRNVAVCMTVIGLGCAGGLYQSHHESEVRTTQFCTLIVGHQNELVKRYTDTVKFLKDPKDVDPGLVTYAKGSLPQVKKTAQNEGKKVPQVCKQKFKVNTIDG